MSKLKMPSKPAPKLRLPAKPVETKAEPLNSLGGERVDGALPLPAAKTIVLARDLEKDETYANLYPHTIAAPYNMHRLVSKPVERQVPVVDEKGRVTMGPKGKPVTKTVVDPPLGSIRVMFYSNTQDWLKVDVKDSYQFTTAPEYLALMPKEPQVDPEIKAKRIAHLKPFMKKAGPVVAGTPDGKRCIAGMVGPDKVLCDAGDGAILKRYPVNGFDADKEAKALKRVFVPQGEAKPEAMVALRRQWAEAKKGKKG